MVSLPFFSFPDWHQNLFISSPCSLQFAFAMSWKHLYLIVLISFILLEISWIVSCFFVFCSGLRFIFSWIFFIIFLSFLMDEFILPHLILSVSLVSF